MVRRSRSIIINSILFSLLILYGISSGLYAQNLTNSGRDFWLAFTECHDLTTAVYQINISSPVATAGNVSIPGTGFSQNFTTTPGIVSKVTLPSADATIVTSELLESRAIHVVADDDVVVYANTYHLYRSEASLVLPTQSLGTEYRAMTYYSQQLGQFKESEFIIVAAGATVTVEITTTANTQGGNLTGVPWTVTINPNQIYQVQALTVADDLTGSLIRAVLPTPNTKFAVYSGNVWAQVSCVGNRDPLYEAVFPVNTWGKEYFILPTPNRSWNEFRVVAAEDTTVISVNKIVVDTLMAGEFYEDTTASVILVEGDKPIMVAMFVITGQCDGYTGSDPSMIVLNPNEQMYLDTITFYTIDEWQIDSNYVHIITRTPDTNTILFNGAPVPNFNVILQDTNYSYATFKVDTGSHTVTTPMCGFLSYVIGMGFAESYAYAAGVLLADLTDTITFYNISAGGNIHCMGDLIQFESGTSGHPISFEWDFGDGDTSTLQDPVHVYTDTGTYIIDLIIEYLCNIDTLQDTILIRLRPFVDLGNDTLFCQGGLITLDAGNPGDLYVWSTGVSTRTIEVTETGTYWVTVSNGICLTFDSIHVEVVSTLDIDAGNDETILKCRKVQLFADSDDDVTYTWDPVVGLTDPFIPDPIAGPLNTTVYIVTIEDTNGCVNWDSVAVIIDGKTGLAIPNAFTPNGDGVNDIIFANSICISDAKFKILNRFGMTVFETNDLDIGWDGSRKGKPQPMDTYVYFLTGVTETGEQIAERGNITLIR